MVEIMEAMTWRILISSGDQQFATSDNPAFHFSSYGLASQESELTFPLATTHALHGSWQLAESLLVFVRASEGVVREVNRRLASTADRAFYHERAPWLLRILPKSKPYLSRLRWSDHPSWRQPPANVPTGSRYALTQRRNPHDE